jgi:hypothetical protein
VDCLSIRLRIPLLLLIETLDDGLSRCGGYGI